VCSPADTGRQRNQQRARDQDSFRNRDGESQLDATGESVYRRHPADFHQMFPDDGVLYQQRAAKVCAMAQRAFGHEGAEAKLREEMKRLQKYLPPNAPDPSVALSDMRTVHLPFHPKLQEKAATGNVVIVFDREGKADVAFKNNVRELEKGKEILAAFKYPQSFPDGTAVKIVRKGTLNCSIYFKDCTLILMKPTEAVVPGNW